MKTLLYISYILFFAVQLTFAQQEKKTITSKIESSFVEGQLTLKATTTNPSDTYSELNYLFVSIKKAIPGIFPIINNPENSL